MTNIYWVRRVRTVLAFIYLSLAASVEPQEAARFEGVWSSSLTTPNDSRWRIEDHLCGTCDPNEYLHLQRLVADPANRDRGLRELQQEAREVNRQQIDELVTGAGRERLMSSEQPADGSLTCDPPSLLVAWGGPLPIAITFRDDNVVLHNQHWNVVRTVRLSSDAPIATGEPSRYGNATARFQGATLIVESVNVLPITTGEAITTARARITERYTASEDGSRLDSEIEVSDPDTYREPRAWYRPRIRTPDVEIVHDDPCANLKE